MSTVHLEGLSKVFHDTIAVDRVSLTLPDGSLTVLVGPSGCGKTTLLRMIAGLEEPTSGAIYMGGEDVSDTVAWERNTAMVFQSYALYPHMTVFENMAFPLRARRLSKAEIRRQVEQTAQSLGIANLLERKPRQLSGGQMQRVALGRAIVRRPHVFLMDEPLSNLDAMLRVETRAELKRLQRDLGITMIYVTHDQEEAMTLADTLVVMRDGRAEQVGGPEEVYHRPQTSFVARFIGSPAMNMLPCRYVPQHHELVTETFRRPAPEFLRRRSDGQTPADLLLGLRPEAITVALDEQPGSVAARVYVAEPLGKETLITLALGAERLKVLVPPELQPAMNDTIWLTFDEQDMHLFDAESGAAIRA
jgi:multiple sugar transport system ATP-binding protein